MLFDLFSAPQAENFRNNRHHFNKFYQYFLVYFLSYLLVSIQIVRTPDFPEIVKKKSQFD